MKKNLHLKPLVVSAAWIILASCGGGGNDPFPESSSNSPSSTTPSTTTPEKVNPELTISEGYQNQKIDETEQVLFVKFTTNVSWTVSTKSESGSSWYHILPEYGTAGNGQIQINVKQNNQEQTRTLVLTIVADNITKEATIQQEGLNPSLTLDEKYQNLHASNMGENIQLEFITNLDWKLTYEGEEAEWAQLITNQGAAGENSVTVVVQPNISLQERTCQFILQVGSLQQKIQLTQDASEEENGNSMDDMIIHKW